MKICKYYRNIFQIFYNRRLLVMTTTCFVSNMKKNKKPKLNFNELYPRPMLRSHNGATNMRLTLSNEQKSLRKPSNYFFLCSQQNITKHNSYTEIFNQPVLFIFTKQKEIGRPLARCRRTSRSNASQSFQFGQNQKPTSWRN